MYLICPNCGLMREARVTTVHTCGRCRARGETIYLTLLPSLNPRDQRSRKVRPSPELSREGAPEPSA